MSIVELLSFLKLKDIPISQAEVDLRENAFYSKEVTGIIKVMSQKF